MDGRSDVSGRPPVPRARSGSILLRLVMLSLLLPVLAACNPFDRGFEWHQRLVLEVETPDGVVSGGSVVAVRVWESMAPGDAYGSLGTDITGEASFMEVAPGRYLSALLGGNSTPGLGLDLFFSDPQPNVWERAELLEDMQGETRVVPPERYPLLVTFTDIDDPASVKQVDPADLEAAFGPGVELKRVVLEITAEDTTQRRLRELLGWLGWSRQEFLAAGNGTNPLKMPNDSPRGYTTIGRTEFVRKAR